MGNEPTPEQIWKSRKFRLPRGKIEEVAEKCSRALTYYDRQNLEYEIERRYKISKGYDKLGFDWAFTDEDRRDMRWQKEEAVEWILLLEVIPIICQPFPQPLDDKEFIKELADLLLKMDIGSLDAPTSVKQEGVEAVAKYKANKLYSALLQPKIEEAKRKEREGILGIIKDWDKMGKIVDGGKTWREKYGSSFVPFSVSYIEELLVVIRQALKGESE